MKRRDDTEIPEFQSIEEERGYWEAHGPLADGHKGRLSRPKSDQRRSSFLAVRLTGEELATLRDIAAKQGLGPSTFARIVLTSVIERGGNMPRRITLDELKDALEENMPQSVKDRAEALFRDTAIDGEPNNPAFLIVDGGQRKAWEEFTWLFISALFASVGVQVILPEDEKYEEVRDIVKAKT